jgi:hypothetical protein
MVSILHSILPLPEMADNMEKLSVAEDSFATGSFSLTSLIKLYQEDNKMRGKRLEHSKVGLRACVVR